MPLADLRKDYTLAGLTEKDLARDPFRQFEKWFQEAEASCEGTYGIPVVYHSCLEPHGQIIQWKPGSEPDGKGDQIMVSKRRDVTVMFTDIVGFTMQAEDLPERETAQFLNEHFALIAVCIEEEHGVIDKFIGDAVMATWGALKSSGASEGLLKSAEISDADKARLKMRTLSTDPPKNC